MRSPSLAATIAANKPDHQRTIRIHACMRALYPNKRDLGFNQQSVDTVVAYFETNYHDTSIEMLLALVQPSDGDLTWAGLSVRDRSVPPNNNMFPVLPTKAFVLPRKDGK